MNHESSLSDFVVPVEILRRGTDVILLSRCSGHCGPQTLQNQTAGVIQSCIDHELSVKNAFEEIAFGRSKSLKNRPILSQAIEMALDTGAVIVVDNIYRLIRNDNNPRTDLIQKTERLLINFARERGITFACVKSIHLSEKEIHSQRTKEGMRLSEWESARSGCRKFSYEDRRVAGV